MTDWNEHLAGIYEIQNRNELTALGFETIDLIKSLNIPFNLDVNKCLENFCIITEQSLFDYREPNFGTTSMTRILTEKHFGTLSPHYSTWFIACFPDVYIWAQPGEHSNLESLELLESILTNQNKFLTKDDKFNSQAYLSLCNFYKAQMVVFETN